VSFLFKNFKDGATVSEFVECFHGVLPEQVQTVLKHAARSTAALN
jgi:uncharacterized protein (DUF433 family)